MRAFRAGDASVDAIGARGRRPGSGSARAATSTLPGRDEAVRTFWSGFFWGPPSHKGVALLGAAAGVVVVALPLVIAVFGTGGHPLFLLALLATGLAETGWAIEVLPRHFAAIAGWGRAARWLCAVVGSVLAVISLVARLAPFWFVGVVAVCAVLLVVEMAPSGFANRA
jgi:hypothetical protein